MGYGQYSSQEKPSKPVLEVKNKKRLRHVFDNPAHVWAHPIEKDGSGFEQTEAWNSQKNFFFNTTSDGTRVLYSYRDTYPIGSTFIHKKKRVYLVRSGKPYSVTTAGHMNQGAGAVPHGAIRFDVPDVVNLHSYYRHNDKPDEVTHKANLADIITRIEESIRESNAAKSLRAVESSLSQARIDIEQARKYAKLFSLKLPKLPAIPVLKQERKDKLTIFDVSREARSTARFVAKQARRAEQQRLDALSREEKIAVWRAGSSARFWNLTGDGYALLRVKGSNVETSMSVSVPINGLTGAGRLLRFLTACKDANRPYQRNGHTEHIGNFTVESFEPVADNQNLTPTSEWILTAGCHRILWSEVETIREAVQEIYKPE